MFQVLREEFFKENFVLKGWWWWVCRIHFQLEIVWPEFKAIKMQTDSIRPSRQESDRQTGYGNADKIVLVPCKQSRKNRQDSGRKT
jgi:hypothetical protein